MTAEQKICANTGSFTVPRNIEGNPVLLGRVKGTSNPSSPGCGFSHQKYTDQNHVDQLCKNMTDDDRALLVLYSSKQESLKASSTSALIGKKRKEATATEIQAYQKQFLEAKQLECKSWLDNEVFDLVDTRKIQVRNCIDELQEITFDKYLKDDTPLTPQMHTAYRSVLGQINWLQSRTQFHIGYQFSRCALKTFAPLIRQSEPSKAFRLV